jgi:hypothetical protein
MKAGQSILLYLASGGMQLTWIYAWASYSLLAVTGRPYPLFEGTAMMVLAAVLTRLHRHRHWRIIQILGLHLLGLTLASYRWIYLCTDRTQPFFNGKWLVAFFVHSRDGQAWMFLVLLLFWALAFWLAGIALGYRSIDARITGSRFDLGLASLFALLLLQFTLKVRGGIEVQGATDSVTLFTYFAFGLLALGLVRYGKDGERVFLSGYHGIGIILTFTVIIIFFGGGLLLLGLSQMTLAAEKSMELIQEAARPLAPIITSFLRFIFSRRSPLEEERTGTSGGEGFGLSDIHVPSEGTPFFIEISFWVIVGIVFFMGLSLVSFGIWHLIRWLFKERGPSKPSSHSWTFMGRWFFAIKQFFFLSKEMLRKWTRGFEKPQDLYGALLKWGRHSGLPHDPSETPKEYCGRLSYHFPRLKDEIGLIVELFIEVVYGERQADKIHVDRALQTWRKFRSPRLWPARLKTVFMRPVKSSRQVS